MRFKFRLEASLNLAKKELEKEQTIFGEKLRLLTQAQEAYDLQKSYWDRALSGQLEASLTRPEQIGLWQKFSQRQLELLRFRENDLKRAEDALEEQRLKLINANQEYEKYYRIREKQEAQFRLEELRTEQKNIDETAQLLFYRKEIS